MSTNGDQHHAPFEVPTIDIAPYLSDPSSPAADEIIKNIHTACVTTGFFQVTGHDVPANLQQSVLKASKAFFALPYEEKKKLDASTTIGHRGYDVLASQSYGPDILPDLKEGFWVGEDNPADDPGVIARRFFRGANVWPSTSLISDATFQKPVEAYYRAVYDLSLRILEMIARTLPYGPHVFDTFTSNHPTALLRMLHYPPQRESDERQFGASAHTDFGAITLLLQDPNPGLEVLNVKTGEWVPITPIENGYVVNIGDMLSMWTKGRYRSSVHRVLNVNPRDRYSIVFFFDGNLDCPLAPLDGSEVEGTVLTAEEHLLGRMRASYAKEK